MKNMLLLLALLIILLAVALIMRHQRSLKLRAHLMREAIRNRDFTFRLPTKGLMPGERAMQETLNQLGSTIRQQESQNEVESWERYTRVLTHEIMNATAPIVSISQSLLERQDVVGTPLEEGIRAIHDTSRHLSAFVDSYRKISQMQQPSPEQVALARLVEGIMASYPDIQWDCSVAEETVVKADPNMLRHTLVNLIKNAVETGAKRIGIKEDRRQDLQESATILYVSNDGAPIPAEIVRNIFIPFFTTKRNGTGIGLPLSRRMMMLQGGNLCLENIPQSTYQTTFSLEFPMP